MDFLYLRDIKEILNFESIFLNLDTLNSNILTVQT